MIKQLDEYTDMEGEIGISDKEENMPRHTFILVLQVSLALSNDCLRVQSGQTWNVATENKIDEKNNSDYITRMNKNHNQLRKMIVNKTDRILPQ